MPGGGCYIGGGPFRGYAGPPPQLRCYDEQPGGALEKYDFKADTFFGLGPLLGKKLARQVHDNVREKHEQNERRQLNEQERDY